MKLRSLPLFVVVLALAPAAPSPAQPAPATKPTTAPTVPGPKEKLPIVNLPGLEVHLDLKALSEGDLGLDYTAEYDYDIGNSKPLDTTAPYFALLSTGYLTSEPDEDEGHIDLEVRGGAAVRFWNTGLDDARREQLLDERDELESRFKDREPTPEEDAKLFRINEALAPLYPVMNLRLTPSVRAKLESDQEFDNTQLVLGIGTGITWGQFGAMETVNRVLDAPFALTRTARAKDRWEARSPTTYFAYDFVTDADIEARQALTDDDSFQRLGFELGYKTLMFDNAILRVVWRVYHELDAPAAIRAADQDFTSFIDVSLAIPLSDGTQVFIKYTDGELPPTFDSSSEVGVGLRFTF